MSEVRFIYLICSRFLSFWAIKQSSAIFFIRTLNLFFRLFTSFSSAIQLLLLLESLNGKGNRINSMANVNDFKNCKKWTFAVFASVIFISFCLLFASNKLNVNQTWKHFTLWACIIGGGKIEIYEKIKISSSVEVSNFYDILINENFPIRRF